MSKRKKQAPLSAYIKHKIKMLKRDFHIPISETEINHISTLRSEIAVDNYARGLILAKLNSTAF